MEDGTEYTGESAAQFTWGNARVKRPGRRLRISNTPMRGRRSSCMLTMSYNLESHCQKLHVTFTKRRGVFAGR